MAGFTRLGVQNSYNYKVKIGNWSEEQELHELKIKEYLHRKEQATKSGGLLLNDIASSVQLSLQSVPLTYSYDNYLHVGDNIMIYSVNSEGVISCDPSDKISTGDKGFAVSTSTLTKAHVARNVFILEAYPSNSGKKGDLLKYGQTIRIRVNSAISGENYYLHSCPISSVSSSKVSRSQAASFVLDNSYDSVWRIHYRDIAHRFEYDGVHLIGVEPNPGPPKVTRPGTKQKDTSAIGGKWAAQVSDEFIAQGCLVNNRDPSGDSVDIAIQLPYTLAKKHGLDPKIQYQIQCKFHQRLFGEINKWAKRYEHMPNLMIIASDGVILALLASEAAHESEKGRSAKATRLHAAQYTYTSLAAAVTAVIDRIVAGEVKIYPLDAPIYPTTIDIAYNSKPILGHYSPVTNYTRFLHRLTAADQLQLGLIVSTSNIIPPTTRSNDRKRHAPT